tara:strand:+ start:503 stop:988 length:486 start_codon:yes stop_codon:yes gene_type:complete
MVKQAPVQVALSGPVSPGKYLVLVSGSEAEVEESLKAGLEDGGDEVVDSLLLSGVHLAAVHAIHGLRQVREARDSLGVVETSTVSAAIVACDAACKEAPVRILEMRLGKGIGGKGVFVLAGELWDVQAAVAAAERSIEARRSLVGLEVIPRPDPEFEGGLD